MKRFVRAGWILILLCIAAGFFIRTFTRGYLPVPADTLVGLYHPWRDMLADSFPRGVPFKNFLITDPVRQQIPWRKVAIDAWKDGSLPVWNPYSFSGSALDANIQSGAYYPFNILFLLMDFTIAWTILIILQPVIGIFLMYAYLRTMKRSRYASAIGAVAWALGGFSIAWLTWGTIVHTAVWLPGMLYCIERMRVALSLKRQKKRTFFAISAVLTAFIIMTVTAGHAQIALYVLLFSFAYYIFRIRGKSIGFVHGFSGGAVILAGMLTAPVWIPFLRSLLMSVRADSGELFRNEGWFLPWRQLIQFVVPDFFGNPATLNYWGEWNYGEFIGYIGIAPFIFAVTALFLPGIPLFFSVSFFVSLFFMLPNPVSYLPYATRFPFISAMQPTRLMVIAAFSLSALSAYGIDAFMKRERRTLPAIILAVCLLIVLFVATAMNFSGPDGSLHAAVARRNMIIPGIFLAVTLIWIYMVKHIVKFRIPGYTTGVLILIVVSDLYRFGWKFTPFTPAEYFFPQTAVTRFLSQRNQPFRVMSLDDRILPPNVSAYYGIESAEGYDPVVMKRYDAYLSASERGNADSGQPSGLHRIYTAHNIRSPLLPYLNIRYILSFTELRDVNVRRVMEEGTTRVYEYLDGLPRAYVADEVLPARSPQHALSMLMEKSPGRVGITETPVDVMSVPLTSDEAVEISQYRTNRIIMNITTDNPRLVVVLNAYDSRWHAYVNGDPVPFIRVNYLFGGFTVPSGTHTAELVYR